MMTAADWEWFALRAMWFAFGAFCMFVFFVAIAPVILSGRISRQEEWTDWSVYSEPEPEPATPERDAELAEAEAKAEFYYRMATGQEAT